MPESSPKRQRPARPGKTTPFAPPARFPAPAARRRTEPQVPPAQHQDEEQGDGREDGLGDDIGRRHGVTCWSQSTSGAHQPFRLLPAGPGATSGSAEGGAGPDWDRGDWLCRNGASECALDNRRRRRRPHARDQARRPRPLSTPSPAGGRDRVAGVGADVLLRAVRGLLQPAGRHHALAAGRGRPRSHAGAGGDHPAGALLVHHAVRGAPGHHGQPVGVPRLAGR